MESRRLTAKKVSIAELMSGRFVKKTGFDSSYVLTNLGRRLSRVRLLGLIVDKFKPAEGTWAAITLDDGNDTTRAKAFQNVKVFDKVLPGDLVDVIGKTREFNGEIYIAPEIVRKVEANFETLRLLELKKIQEVQKEKVKKISELKKQTADGAELKTLAKKFNLSAEDVDGILEVGEIAESAETVVEKKDEAAEIKKKVLELISTLDKGEGADYAEISKTAGADESVVDNAIQTLLEEGILIEPKAGRLKKL